MENGKKEHNKNQRKIRSKPRNIHGFKNVKKRNERYVKRKIQFNL